MSQADKDKWDGRYGQAPYRMGAGPNGWLRDITAHLPTRGRAVDLAAGEGQNAVYLARRGLDVLAVDVSPVGLAKAADLAEVSGVAIETLEADLADGPFPLARGTCQLITCFHYLQRDLLADIAAALAPGGVVAMEVCGVPNLERHAHPSRRYLAEPGEMRGWFPSLEATLLEEGWRGDRFVCRIIARRER